MSGQMKYCSKCNTTKPVDDFYAGKNGKPRSWCKPCWGEYHRIGSILSHRMQWVTDGERLAASQRAKYALNRDKTREARAMRKRTDKYRATQFVYRALRSGRLSKPDTCSACGESTPNDLLHGHHDDYSQPLAVRWLCRPCHAVVHRLPDSALDKQLLEATR